MVFSSNPLSLSVPDPAFETWLRDSGYLEVLDQRTSELHRISKSTLPTATNSTIAASSSSTATGVFVSFFSRIFTILSVFTLNPISKLTTDDFSGQTPPWTTQFVGSCHSYCFPSSTTQARLRVHENVKRYARNYATLFVLVFACTLYKMPIALVGLLSSLALWDVFKFCSERWGLGRYPVVRQCLIRVAQCVTAVILIYSNVQMALFCALGVSYAAMILHAAFRKLTPVKQHSRGRR
ncbi:hypothetical protein FNV43_RR15931 [Rhamnella rubrinervis]|uniref:PRA1 family protein n=1 Tax=Rhamnella rubrinervis TaxID=2594499 RepID=A0A8K0GYE8_9ROSA|nr:hypothetical protein FNV43_RR15931 [Rhamnella rubrinervis]